jgi:hypothetical protein
MKTIAVLVALVALLISFVGCASDSTAPSISGVAASGATASSATITWTTDEPASSQVEYGLTTSYGSTTASDTRMVTGHSVTLSGLSPGTTYHYLAVSLDEAGNKATSLDWSFTTLTQLTLTGSQVVTDIGHPALQVQFTATDYISLRLTNPDGVQTGSASAEKGVTAAILAMAGYYETPDAGVYTLIVEESSGAQIATQIFTYLGGSASISDVSLTWYWSTWSLDYTLDGISFKATNAGDLPVCMYKGELSIDGNQETLYVTEAVLPGEQKTITETTSLSGISSGQHTLTVTLKDYDEKVVCTYSRTVTPS